MMEKYTETEKDASLQIRNIVARWPGSCHDRLSIIENHLIFNHSRLKFNFENGRYTRFLLIGDSGYAVQPYLLTPLQTTNTEPERLYNEALVRSRNVVERQYGVWKRRFPILSRGIQVDVNTAMTIIIVTAVLHNIAVEMNEDLPDNFDNPVEIEQEVHQHNNENQYAQHFRTMFINNHFNL
ncbi:hypothetical protein NQ315_016286 [Exocentrus adspersus]|uniref:DDE Tnp4 domain-containing protein n=1 Tax=Exocentrus adspersus TaxID=1586481 RepID=A0AAV8VCM2_9CUCU|nr:hypothetical protein NQ315_016286 [Exocentrus adspersus]